MSLEGMLTFAVAFAASCSLIVPIRRIALHWGIVDRPERSQNPPHTDPFAPERVAIYCGTVLSASFGLWRAARAANLWDSGRFHVVAAESASCGRSETVASPDQIICSHAPRGPDPGVALGVKTHVGSALLPGTPGAVLDTALTLLWVVGITAAYNIFDHMRCGLASGITAIASLFFSRSWRFAKASFWWRLWRLPRSSEVPWAS